MPQHALLLIEKSPYEAAVARIALMLYGTGFELLEAPDLAAADKAIRRARPPVALAILGKSALGALRETLPVPAIALGARLTEADKRRAAAAGIEAVHERPRQWKAYCALVERLLAERLATRKA